VRSRGAAHELLARVALAHRSAELARHEAKLAQAADKSLPLPEYVDGRLLYDQGKFDEALASFEEAAAAVDGENVSIADLHFQTAETLVKLDRLDEAEAAFERELHDYPHNSRARSGLAILLHKMGRNDEAEQTLADMIRITPTPESYTMAAHLWTTFGNRRQANAVRVAARQALASPK
jgi:tetratricopeptide (TPR) repeat protein